MLKRVSLLKPLALIGAAALSLPACSWFQNVPPAERRAVIISLDGAAAPLIDRMVAKGVMPNLARLKARGAWPAYSVTNFPSKTAAGHAALWTGAFGDINGIAGNKVFKLPLETHSILAVEDGFKNTALMAEPIWVTAARAGKRVVVLQATHGTPLSSFEPGGRFGGPFPGSLTLLDGFAGTEGKDGLVSAGTRWRPARGWTQAPESANEAMETPFRMGARPYWAMAFDDPRDPVKGYDTLALAPHKSAAPVLLKPGAWTDGQRADTAGGPGYIQFHLFGLDPGLASWQLYHTPATRALTNKPEVLETWYGATTPFMPQGPGRLWVEGSLGPTLFQGGDGSAEARYGVVMGRMADLMRQRLARLLTRPDWELAIHYLPFPDEALHHWYGGTDPNGPDYDPAKAAKTWTALETIFRHVDSALAPLATADSRTVVVIGSDHGMTPTHWNFFPNVVLQRAGLLKLDKQGKVDLAHTKVIYADTDAAFLAVNRQGRQGGIVAARDVEAVLNQAEAALRAIKTHDGKPLVTEFLRKNSEEARRLGIGGSRAGDMYLDLAPGYYFAPGLKSASLFQKLDQGRAGHIFDPRRTDMHAFMVLAGPGIKRGVSLPPVRNIDMAPTVCKLLGIPTSAQATGQPIAGALLETK